MTMFNAHGQPRRHRRCQLSVPASNTKMIEKAAASGVDHAQSRFHLVKLRVADQSFGFRSQRGVDGQVINRG